MLYSFISTTLILALGAISAPTLDLTQRDSSALSPTYETGVACWYPKVNTSCPNISARQARNLLLDAASEAATHDSDDAIPQPEYHRTSNGTDRISLRLVQKIDELTYGQLVDGFRWLNVTTMLNPENGTDSIACLGGQVSASVTKEHPSGIIWKFYLSADSGTS